MILTFNIDRIVQVLGYLQKETGTTNYMKLLKLVFFADRLHLRRYGHLFTYDNYKAMKLGSLGSQTKDVATQESFYLANLSDEERQIIESHIQSIDKYDIEIKFNASDMLSQSCLDSLDFSIKNFGSFEAFELSEITHDYPEWKRYEDILLNKKTEKVKDICLEDMFDDPDLNNSPNLRKYLDGKDVFKEDKDFLQFMKMDFINKHNAPSCILHT